MIRPKKSLGQNFLVDPGVADRIIKAVAPRSSDLIVEIGPGMGALTSALVERAGYLVAIEIDPRLAEQLRSHIRSEKLLLIEKDVLEIDWPELAEQGRMRMGRPGQGISSDAIRLRVVANLPYYISTAIIGKLLTSHVTCFDLHLMLQEEVVDRITSGPGGRDYGYLSLLVQYYTEPTKLFRVRASAFKPAPKVNSAVVRLVVRSRPAVQVLDEGDFFAMIRAAFAQRRKTILNNLKSAEAALSFRANAAEGLGLAQIDPRRRAETLSLQEFAELYKSLRMPEKSSGST